MYIVHAHSVIVHGSIYLRMREDSTSTYISWAPMTYDGSKASRQGEARGNRTDQLRDRIEQAIISGEYPPGFRLEEPLLAQRYNVSRTPVREALMQLASAGLVEIRPRQGAIVASPTVQDILEMFEVMASLEGLCVELAARRITAEELAELEQVHERCGALAAAGDPDGYYAENRRFHEALYAASRNRFLEETTRSLRNRVAPYRRLQLRHRGRTQRSWAEHGAILEAIRSGDGPGARAAMMAHIAIQGDTFMDFLSSLPPAYIRLGAD